MGCPRVDVVGSKVFGAENGVMCGDPKSLPNSPIVKEIRIVGGVIQTCQILDVHSNTCWVLMQVRDMLLDVPRIKEASSLSKDVPDKAVCCQQISIHLLEVITINELVSLLIEVLGDNPGPYGNVRCFIGVQLLGCRLEVLAGTNRPRWESPCRLMLVDFQTRPRSIPVPNPLEFLAGV